MWCSLFSFPSNERPSAIAQRLLDFTVCVLGPTYPCRRQHYYSFILLSWCHLIYAAPVLHTSPTHHWFGIHTCTFASIFFPYSGRFLSVLIMSLRGSEVISSRAERFFSALLIRSSWTCAPVMLLWPGSRSFSLCECMDSAIKPKHRVLTIQPFCITL